MTDSHTLISLFDRRASQIVYGIEGLFLVGGTVRARGAEIDKAARIGFGAAQAAVDRRLGHLASAARH